MRIVRRHIGRIGHDEIEALPAHRVKPVACTERHVARVQTRCIVVRHLESGSGLIHGNDVSSRACQRNADGDAAAAGAEVKHLPSIALQCQLHQQFGFGTRYQHRRRDPEHLPIEFALADNVRHRLAGHATRQQRAKTRFVWFAQRIAGVCDEIDVIHRQRGAQQHARINGRYATALQRLRDTYHKLLILNIFTK